MGFYGLQSCIFLYVWLETLHFLPWNFNHPWQGSKLWAGWSTVHRFSSAYSYWSMCQFYAARSQVAYSVAEVKWAIRHCMRVVSVVWYHYVAWIPEVEFRSVQSKLLILGPLEHLFLYWFCLAILGNKSRAEKSDVLDGTHTRRWYDHHLDSCLGIHSTLFRNVQCHNLVT